jgi:hypothetical protein
VRLPRPSGEPSSDSALADDVAALLDAHPEGLSGSAVAVALRRRKLDVLDVLDAPRFVKVGRGPSSRWHNAGGTGWEPIHGPAMPEEDGNLPPEEIEPDKAA